MEHQYIIKFYVEDSDDPIVTKTSNIAPMIQFNDLVKHDNNIYVVKVVNVINAIEREVQLHPLQVIEI